VAAALGGAEKAASAAGAIIGVAGTLARDRAMLGQLAGVLGVLGSVVRPLYKPVAVVE